jgi:hypothetical protein
LRAGPFILLKYVAAHGLNEWYAKLI